MLDHHSGLSRVRAGRGARATAGPAEAAATSHSESIAVRATAPRESARHAAHIILACRASRSGSARVRVRSRTRAHPHVSSAATSILRRRDRQIDYVTRAFPDKFEHVPLRDRTLFRSERFLKSRTIIMRMFHSERKQSHAN